MNATMSTELYWLALNVAYTSLLFLPYAYERISRIGLWRLFTSPLSGDAPFPQEHEWAQRAYRAHMNGIENIVLFAPLVFLVQITGAGNDVTALACAVYFWARAIHAPSYILNIPFARTLAYFVGLGACFVLLYQVLLR